MFGKKYGDEATMTAANSTPLTDGASAVLLASDEWAAEHTLPVLAHFVDAETGAVDYVHGDVKYDGLLMAPVYAVPRLLARNKLTLDDFDFIEIHEAFACTVLATMKAWEDAEFCRARLGLDKPLGSVDRGQAQRQRLVAGRRPPVRRHRRAHRRHAGQDAAREGLGPRPDLDLRRRRPGRHRDPRSQLRRGDTDMSDRYLNLVNSSVGSAVASRVGPAAAGRAAPLPGR